MFELINNPYLDQEIATIVVLFHRSNLVIKYIYLLLGILAFISIVIIWGVKKDQIFLFISSVFAVAGVASFAQWSILSNITAGIILFFSYPFKIGDRIKIHDKDFPIESEIVDIKAFYVVLKSSDGELITYPNNLIMQKGVSVLRDNAEEKEFFD